MGGEWGWLGEGGMGDHCRWAPPPPPQKYSGISPGAYSPVSNRRGGGAAKMIPKSYKEGGLVLETQMVKLLLLSHFLSYLAINMLFFYFWQKLATLEKIFHSKVANITHMARIQYRGITSLFTHTHTENMIFSCHEVRMTGGGFSYIVSRIAKSLICKLKK